MGREFLKDNVRLRMDFSKTDQNKGISPPSLQKSVPENALILDLPKDYIPKFDLSKAIAQRRSRRSFNKECLSLEELSFLLWSTQGIRKVLDYGHAFRNVPSAGCRHAFETYLAVFNVKDIEKGIYRYLPLTHQLLFIGEKDNLELKISRAAFGQEFVGNSAVTFIWTTIPYRMEWRYGEASYKVIALDAGHICQNLYLGCEAIGCGTCAIAAYNQELMDNLLEVDGEEEFTVYVAPVGKIKGSGK